MQMLHPVTPGSFPPIQEGVEMVDVWICPFCRTPNTLQQLNCHHCLVRKPGEKVDHKAEQDRFVPKRGSVRRSLTERLRSVFAKEPLEWTCPACTLLNEGYRIQCRTCGFCRDDVPVRRKEDPPAVRREASTRRREGAPTRKREDALEGRRGKAPTARKEVTSDRNSGQQSWSLSSLLSSLVSWRASDSGQKEEQRKRGKGRIVTDGGDLLEREEATWYCTSCASEDPSSVDQCAVCEEKRKQAEDNIILGSFEELNVNGEHVSKRRKLSNAADPPDGDSPTSMLSGDSGVSSMPSIRRSPRGAMANSCELDSSSRQPSLANDRSYPTGHRRYHSNGKPPLSLSDRVSEASSSLTPYSHPEQPQSLAEIETWKCSLCGAYSLVSLPKCFVCGIGTNPSSLKKPSWKAKLFGSQKGPQPSLSDRLPRSNHVTNTTSSSTSHPPLSSDPLLDREDTPEPVPESQEDAKEQPPPAKILPKQRDNHLLPPHLNGHSSAGPLRERSNSTTCTVLISEERQQAELEASSTFQRIQKFCRKVSVCTTLAELSLREGRQQKERSVYNKVLPSPV